MQMSLTYKLKDDRAAPVEGVLYNTIHAVPR